MRKGNGSELPLPLWERVGVRGYGLTIDRNPSPGSHLTMRSDLSRKGRGEVSGGRAEAGRFPRLRACSKEEFIIMINRVEITDKAADVVARLREQHGGLMFHQSGGCCDGSAPMCYPAGDFRVGPQDVLLGKIAGCDFYIGAAQFEYWQHTQLIIDVVPGRGSGFSVEAPEGVRFLTRSRVFTDDEVTELEAAGPPSRAA
jgi:uncharacterized protein (DUF779 family)